MVVELVSRVLIPAIQLFAFYVIFHGHYSPGGGFQGGVLLATSILLLRLTQAREESLRRFPPGMALVLAAAGMFIFVAMGLASVVLGGAFMDYASLPPAGATPGVLRYYGIMVVEVAIAMTVWGTLVVIFDQLGTRRENV